MRLILALVSFFIFFIFIESKVVLPLTFHQGLKNKLSSEGKWEEFHARFVRSRPKSKAAGTIPLYDYFNDFFSHQIQVGTPPQTLIIRPDTSSSDLWFMDKNKCKSSQCSGFPSLTSNFNRTLFDSTKSSTYATMNPRFSSYNGGAEGLCVNGSLGSDMFMMAGFNPITQEFGLCSDVDPFMGLHPFDGYLGLAWPSLAVGGVTPVVQNMIASYNFDKPVFSIYLDKNNNGGITYGSGTAGSITYGGLDTTNCDTNIGYAPLSSKTYWQFTLSSFTYGSYSLNQNQQAIVSTAEAIIIVPDTILSQMVAIINPTSFPIIDGAKWIYNCSALPSLPPLDFTIGGISYKIPATTYFDGEIALLPGMCPLRVESPEGFGFGPSWILGTPFMRTYCVHHDVGNSQIGFSAQTPTHAQQK